MTFGTGTFIGLAALLVALACSPPPPPIAEAKGAIVYGADSRIEGYDLGEDPRRSSAVALLDPEGMSLLRGAAAAVPTAQQRFGLCPDERFSGQPSVVACSGVLVGSRTVLTAAHCLSGWSCETGGLVVGLELTRDGVLAPPPEDRWFRCAGAWVGSSATQRMGDRADVGAAEDWALIRLDRAALTGHVPSIAEEVPPPGATVSLWGHPQGLPLKVDPSGVVIERPEACISRPFRAALDGFGGSSGSGVFDEASSLGSIWEGDRTMR